MRRQIVEGIPKAERQSRRQGLGTLRSLVIRPATVERYQRAFQKFVHFLAGQNPKNAPTKSQVDSQLEEYIEFLWKEGEGISLAGDTISSIQHFQPSMKNHLQGAWRLLKTWQRNELPARAPPFTNETLAVFLGCTADRSHEIAVAMYIAFKCLLRTGELLAIQARDFLFPPQGTSFILYLGDTKTAPRNPHAGTVICHDLAAVYLRKRWKSSVSDDAFLVPWSGSKFRSFFQEVLNHSGLLSYKFKPYSLRRGGATDLWMTCRNYSQIAHVGRWSAERTVKIYIQDNIALLTDLSFVRTPLQSRYHKQWQEVSWVEPRHSLKKRGRGRDR